MSPLALKIMFWHPPSDPPKITAFTQVSEDTVDKIIRNSSAKSYLLDPWPTFLIKNQLQSRSTAHSWRVYVPDGFKTAIVTPLIKNATLLVDDLKNYHHVSGLSFHIKIGSSFGSSEPGIPDSLPHQFNLLTQPFNGSLHRDLLNLNFHAFDSLSLFHQSPRRFWSSGRMN